jgi:hypothetical protein
VPKPLRLAHETGDSRRVWIDPWLIVVPDDGSMPHVERDTPPANGVVEDDAVTVSGNGKELTVRIGEWNVLLEEGAPPVPPIVVRVEAHRPPTTKRFRGRR